MDQLPRLEKRELICLLLFTCNYVVSVWRGFLFLWVLGMGYVILLWHSLSLGSVETPPNTPNHPKTPQTCQISHQIAYLQPKTPTRKHPLATTNLALYHPNRHLSPQATHLPPKPTQYHPKPLTITNQPNTTHASLILP